MASPPSKVDTTKFRGSSLRALAEVLNAIIDYLNGGTSTSSGNVSQLTVAPGSFSLQVGGTQLLTVTAIDAFGTVDSCATINFSSSNSQVATVTPDGLVTGVSAGTATITATAGGASQSVVVTVTGVPAQTVAMISLVPNNLVMVPGQTAQLTAVAKDSLGNVVSSALIQFTSSVGTTAAVSQTGVVTAVANGSTLITASVGAVQATCTVLVQSQAGVVASVEISPTTGSVAVGATLQMAAVAKDAYGAIVPGAAFSWTSGAPGVMTVSASGLVTGIGVGPAFINVTANGITATASLTGIATPTGVSITGGVTNVTMIVGTQQVTPLFTVRDALNNPVSGALIACASTAPSTLAAFAGPSPTGPWNGTTSGGTFAVQLTASIIGTATVNLTSGSATATISVTVIASPTSFPESDDFNTGTMDTTGSRFAGAIPWSPREIASDGTTMTTTLAGGLATLSYPANSGQSKPDLIKGWTEPVATTDNFTYRLRFIPADTFMTADARLSFFMEHGTGAARRVISCEIGGQVTGTLFPIVRQAFVWKRAGADDAKTVIFSPGYGLDFSSADWAKEWEVEMIVGSTNNQYNFRARIDGGTWFGIHGGNYADGLDAKPTRVGIGVSNHTASTASATLEWFHRVSDSSAP